MNFLSLPRDIHRLVLGYLNIQSLMRLFRTSKQYRHLVSSCAPTIEYPLSQVFSDWNEITLNLPPISLLSKLHSFEDCNVPLFGTLEDLLMTSVQSLSQYRQHLHMICHLPVDPDHVTIPDPRTGYTAVEKWWIPLSPIQSWRLTQWLTTHILLFPQCKISLYLIPDTQLYPIKGYYALDYNSFYYEQGIIRTSIPHGLPCNTKTDLHLTVDQLLSCLQYPPVKFRSRKRRASSLGEEEDLADIVKFAVIQRNLWRERTSLSFMQELYPTITRRSVNYIGRFAFGMGDPLRGLRRFDHLTRENSMLLGWYAN